MTKENKLEILRNRMNVIVGKGNYTQGVIRKLERQIRNLEKEV